MTRTGKIFWLAFFPLSLLLRLVYLDRNWIILDEFQHLHASYLVSIGQIPFRDFFEHHTPLFYYLMAPFIRVLGPGFDTIIHLRGISLLAFVSTLVLLMIWARRLSGWPASYLVGALVLGNFSLFKSGAILYLDVFAIPSLVLSAQCLSRSRQRPILALASGFFFGIAILFTQKAVVVGLAFLLYFGVRAWQEWNPRSQRRSLALEFFSYLSGGFFSLLGLALLLPLSAWGDFFEDVFVTNLAWRARHFPTHELKVLAGTDAAVYFVALAGLAVWFRRFLRRRLRVAEEDFPCLVFFSLCAGVFLIPVVWTEYFVQVAAFSSLVAGLALVEFYRYLSDEQSGLLRSFGDPRWRLASSLVGVFCILQILDLVGRKVVAPVGPVQGVDRRLSDASLLITLALWLILGATLAVSHRHQSRSPAHLVVALILVFPLVEQVDFINDRPNHYQRVRVEYVLQHTKPGDPVFYGYDGYGVFRPHVYKYWFLHDEMQMMLSDREREREIIDSIERIRPPILIHDRWVKRLPASFQEYVARHYRDTEYEEIKRRRP